MNQRLLLLLLFSFVITTFQSQQPALGQVYVVDSDSADFMDESIVVGPAKRGSEIYALEEKDGWLKAVEPKTQMPAWVAKSKTKLKAFTKAEFAEESQLWDQVTRIEVHVRTGARITVSS